MTPLVAIVAFLIVTTFAVRHLQRTLFYPLPRSMPQTGSEDIDAALREFEIALEKHAPDILAALQPGLSANQIEQIESHHRLRLTSDIRALYRWRNGANSESQVELIPGHRFITLEQAAQARDILRDQVSSTTLVQRIANWIFAGHRTNWLTILDDGCGAGYFYDSARRRQPGSFFYHFDENQVYRFFPCLAAFLAGAAECYDTGIYRVGRRGGTTEDHERAYELWARYAST